MISTKYIGQLGNNLFQFAFSAVLSRLSGIPFTADEVPGFPGTVGRSAKSELDNKGIAIRGQARDINLNRLAALAQTTNISVGGYPQSTHYYESHKQWLCKLLAPELGDYEKSTENDVVVHLRIGDFFHGKPKNAHYPVIGIHHILRSIDFETCLIATDTPNDPMVKALQNEFPCKVLHGSVMDDYRTLYQARRLIISPSTFSWWAAWSGRPKQVFCPFNIGFWKVQKNSLILKGKRVRYWDGTGLLNSIPETSDRLVSLKGDQKNGANAGQSRTTSGDPKYVGGVRADAKPVERFRVSNLKTLLFTNSDDRYLKLQDNLLSSMAKVDFPMDTVDVRAVDGAYGVYGSKDFNETAMKKLEMVCSCLKEGNTVLFVDVDIVFLKNPLRELLRQLGSGIDTIFQSAGQNSSKVNTGFFMASPTEAAISLFDVSNWTPQETSLGAIEDQDYVNMKLGNVENKGFAFSTLPLGQFPTGNYWFAGKADEEPTLVHYNYLLGVDSKIKRMQSYGHWFL